MNKVQFIKLIKQEKELRREARELSRKRHELMDEKKKKGYKKPLGLKMHQLGSKREIVYKKLDQIRKIINRVQFKKNNTERLNGFISVKSS